MLLTKHEGETFKNQTVYISGQAFVRCTFINCVLLLRETIYHLEGCTFDRCNWHIDTVMLWGSAESVRQVKAIVTLLEQGLQNIQEQGGGGAGSADVAEGTAEVPPDGPSPFAT